jgi:hypothetical protein
LSFITHASLRALLLGAIGCQAEAPRCVDRAPVLLESGAPSGFEKCADGAIDRVSSAAFVPVNTGPVCTIDEPNSGCSKDADCTDGPHGRCNQYVSLVGRYCGCEYACATDEDCATGTVCVPPELSDGASRPRCVAAACKGGADCPSGECGLADSFNGCYQVTELRCRDAAIDACRGDGDCAHLGTGYTCDNLQEGGGFECVARGCVVGRPLLIAGMPRVAPTVLRGDWRYVSRPSEAS